MGDLKWRTARELCLAEPLCENLNLTEEQTHAVADQMLGCLKLFDRKQRDYGSGNIAVFGDKGILIRLFDKLHRLKNLYDRGGEAAVAESIEDTWRDLCNYAAMALTCRAGKWEGYEPRT